MLLPALLLLPLPLHPQRPPPAACRSHRWSAERHHRRPRRPVINQSRPLHVQRQAHGLRKLEALFVSVLADAGSCAGERRVHGKHKAGGCNLFAGPVANSELVPGSYTGNTVPPAPPCT
eukprot:SM001697S02655  [mRNA]  locus=s1697:1374:1951:- [translate_table: standard]